MNSEEGNPFRSSNLEQEFQRHNDDISINEGGSSNPSAKSSLEKRKASSGFSSYFPQGVVASVQPSIKAKLQSIEKWRQVDLCVARFFHDCCIPFNYAHSIYY